MFSDENKKPSHYPQSDASHGRFSLPTPAGPVNNLPWIWQQAYWRTSEAEKAEYRKQTMLQLPRIEIRRFVCPLILVLFLLAEIGLLAGQEPAWHMEKGFKWADLDVPDLGKTGFTLLPPERTGITFTNFLDEKAGAANRVLFNGAGVAVGDYDNDGLPDIYFCGLDGRNALYRNLGNWKFKDVTSESGVACGDQHCRGAVFADVNGDGHLDLLVAVAVLSCQEHTMILLSC